MVNSKRKFNNRIIPFLFLIYACNNDGREVNFKLINRGNFPIDSCYIEVRNTKDKPNYITVDSQSSVNYSIDLSKYKGDGDFKIHYYSRHNNSAVSRYFGYFTNGTIDSDTIEILFEKDTVIIDWKSPLH